MAVLTVGHADADRVVVDERGCESQRCWSDRDLIRGSDGLPGVEADVDVHIGGVFEGGPGHRQVVVGCEVGAVLACVPAFAFAAAWNAQVGERIVACPGLVGGAHGCGIEGGAAYGVVADRPGGAGVHLVMPPGMQLGGVHRGGRVRRWFLGGRGGGWRKCLWYGKRGGGACRGRAGPYAPAPSRGWSVGVGWDSGGVIACAAGEMVCHGVCSPLSRRRRTSSSVGGPVYQRRKKLRNVSPCFQAKVSKVSFIAVAAGRFPDNELRVEQQFVAPGDGGRVVGRFQQAIDGGAADLGERLADRGQRWRHVFH